MRVWKTEGSAPGRIERWNARAPRAGRAGWRQANLQAEKALLQNGKLLIRLGVLL
jgi:hypothetical protein